MARRTKRRGTTPPRKRPGAPRSSTAVPQQAAGSVPDGPTAAEQRLPEGAASPNEGTVAQPASSGLPRRGAAEAREEQIISDGAPPTGASESLLPKRTRIAGRAELRRRQEANLEPLDDSPGVPLDRTPYLRMDVRGVIWVSLAMLALVILGLIFIH
ncbi:MAG: hypothetical protein M0027_12940 [Candidatus Dormibacteraeota bacterium]|nr:hypothetical protein [Candidatus Dormibacteraeota bacterium]